MSNQSVLAVKYEAFKNFASKKLYSYLEFLYYFKPRYLLCFIFGFLASLALPPLYLFPLFIIAIFSIIRLTDFSEDVFSAYLVGFFFCFGFGLGAFYWVSFSLLANKSLIWAFPIALIALPVFFAAYSAIPFAIYKLVSNYINAIERVVLFSVLWCIFEYLRGYSPISFPLNFVGYTLSFSTSIMQFTSVVGVFGYSLYVMILASSFHLLFLDGDGDKYYSYLRYILIWIVGLLFLFVYGYTRISHDKDKFNESVKIRIVQGGIEESSDWSNEYREKVLSTYINMTQSSPYENITHIIWPESAIPYSTYDNPNLITQLTGILKNGQILMSGSLRAEESKEKIGDIKIYNTVTMLDSLGRTAYYDKVKLVPFGEFIPLRPYIPFIKKITNGSIDFSEGAMMRVYDILNTPAFLPLVCYEISFSGSYPYNANKKYKDEYGITRVKKVPLEWILNTTNDAWFGYSSGPFQHLTTSKIRAIEYGVPVIRSASTGISAVIDPYGNILQKISLKHSGVIDTALPSKLPRTIFSIVGNYPTLIFLIFMCFVFAVKFVYEKYYHKTKNVVTNVFNVIDKTKKNTNKPRD